MTAQDRKKLTQLSRRLKAADARYRSLEKRAGVIEERRTRLEEKAGRLFDLLMSAKGARAGSKRRLSLAAQFKRAKDEAQRLRRLEDGIYSQLRDVEEKIATLEDNMRKATKNPQTRGEKAQRAQDAKIRKSINAYLAKGWNFQQIHDRLWLVFGLTLESVDSDKAVFAELFSRNKWILYLNPARGGVSSERMKNPRGKHLPGATAKQQRQYEHILESAKKYHRYGKRKKEVAARTVEARPNPPNVFIVSAYNKQTKRREEWTQVDETARKALKYVKEMKLYRSRYFGEPNIYTNWKVRAKNPKRNPSAKSTLRKAGRSAKSAVRSTLDAGSKLLSAGARAIKNTVNLKKFPDDKLQAYKADLESSLTKLKASGGGKATVRFVQGRINAVNRELKKRNPHKRIRVKNAYIDLVIKGQAKKTPQGWQVGRKTFAQGRGTTKVSSGYYLDKATGLVYAKRERANPTRKGMRKGYREAKRISKITRGRYFSSEAGQRKAARHEKRQTRKRNADYEYKVKGRLKYKGVGKRLEQTDTINFTVLATDIESAKSRARERIGNRYQYAQSYAGSAKVYRTDGSGKIIEESSTTFSANPKSNSKRKRNLDHRDSTHQVKVHQHWRAGGLSQWQRAHHAGQRPLFEHGIKVKPKRNPSAKSIRKKFAGRVTGSKTMYYAKGAPAGSMAKLGKLASIKIEGRRNPIKPTRRNPSVDLWLCCDTHGKLWLASSRPGLMFDGPPQNLGRINEIEYVEAKPHLGNPHQTLYFHKLGEEDGRKPSLHVDQHGDLLIKGGAYRVTGRGIEN